MKEQVRLYRRALSGTSILAVATLAFPLVTVPVAFAKPATASSTADISVYATGFNNPRGLKFGPDGHLYVAEGGPWRPNYPGRRHLRQPGA